METEKPAEAVRAYEAVLKDAPGRRNALAGLEAARKELAARGTGSARP
jgi:hypothetical protein